MNSYTIQNIGLNQDQARTRWLSHSFYQSDIVLGLDIGLRGIGVCVRKGPEIIYAKTWTVDLPAAKALADRRAKRAWRHCRENRKTRLRRLAQLFAAHGLPWFEENDPALLRTDPFLLRHRALTSSLASKEAIAIAIRHIVQHRGYDFQYFNDEGAYPWGEATDAKTVLRELRSLWIMPEDADPLLAEAEGFGWKDSELSDFQSLLKERTVHPAENPIRQRLASHAAEKRTHLRSRAKGEAFPRTLVWQHLVEIVERHSHLIDDAPSFIAALSIRPQQDKERAIFFYHRKTPEEMRAHFEKKVRRCRYAPWLGLSSDIACDERGHPDISRFFLLEFLATRRVEMADTERTKQHLPASVILDLLDWQAAHHAAWTARAPLPRWVDARRLITDALRDAHGSKVHSDKDSPFNKVFFSTIKDLLAPTAANRRQRASLSALAAQRLSEIMAEDGLEPAAMRESLRRFGYYDFKRTATIDALGLYPQVEFLLGRRARRDRNPTARHPHRRKAGELAVLGRLHQLFDQLSPRLDGRTTPDCCIVEVIRDAPRTDKQAREIADEMEERRSTRGDIFQRNNLDDTGSRSTRLRLKLWEQQFGRSPFTGVALGTDPLSADLQIEHLFPQTRGGLWVEDNLVLTTTAENQLKNNRTPFEASSDLTGSWQAMLAHSAGMRWSAKKRALFEWRESTVPDFGNTTRTSQLARQLTAEVARWLGIEDIKDDTVRENTRALRIATPAGYLTATARVAWRMPRKDRSDLAHHLVDAVTLAFIPPREGLNAVSCGGLFHNQWDPTTRKTRLTALAVGPEPLSIEPLVAPDADSCPIIHFRSTGSAASRHDQTLLSVAADGTLSSRVPLRRQDFGQDADALRAALVATGITMSLIPARSALQAWLLQPEGSVEASTEGAPSRPLRLTNGTPVLHVRKVNTKDNANPPFGLVARLNDRLGWQGVKIIATGKFAGLTIMRRWIAAKGKKPGSWRFYVQRVPDRHAMESLLRLGFRWLLGTTRLSAANPANTEQIDSLLCEQQRLTAQPKRWAYLTVPHIARQILRRLIQAGFLSPLDWPSVEKAIWGAEISPGDLPVIDPSTSRPCFIQKGDTFRLRVTTDGRRPAPGAPYQLRWYRVAAIKSNGSVKFIPLQDQALPEYSLTANDLAGLFHAHPSDDPPPDPGAGQPDRSPPPGEAGFRLE